MPVTINHLVSWTEILITRLNLIRNDSACTEPRANFIRMHGIEVAQSQACDEALLLKLPKALEGVYVLGILVIVPMELEKSVSRDLQCTLLCVPGEYRRC